MLKKLFPLWMLIATSPLASAPIEDIQLNHSSSSSSQVKNPFAYLWVNDDQTVLPNQPVVWNNTFQENNFFRGIKLLHNHMNDTLVIEEGGTYSCTFIVTPNFETNFFEIFFKNGFFNYGYAQPQFLAGFQFGLKVNGALLQKSVFGVEKDLSELGGFLLLLLELGDGEFNFRCDFRQGTEEARVPGKGTNCLALLLALSQGIFTPDPIIGQLYFKVPAHTEIQLVNAGEFDAQLKNFYCWQYRYCI